MGSHPLIEPKSREQYTVGWVCALPKEQTAATAMLHQRHCDLPKPVNDPNVYTLGSIGKHNVVISCLPKKQIGPSQAAAVAARMVAAFPSIKFGLMVGIGGGIPTKVRLGDVVVSTPTGQFPGVVQWDFGKAKEGGIFERTGALNNPPTLLLAALSRLETKHEMSGSKIPAYLDEMGEKWPRLVTKYLRSDLLEDNLFRANYPHLERPIDSSDGTSDDERMYADGEVEEEDEEEEEEEEEQGQTCRFCDKTKLVKRKPRGMRVHFGLVASGNQLIKDALLRQRLNQDLGGQVLCIEMEAAGLMNDFPCLVIRGICDYADSHKNDAWQEHAAAVAAAFAKELLECVQPSEVNSARPAKEILGQILESVSEAAEDIQCIRTFLGSKEDLEVLEWFAPETYGPQQSDHLSRRREGTGRWFIESVEFQTWLSTEKQILFCPGIPGAGKTILSAIVIDELGRRYYQNKDIGIAYVYCNFRREAEQTVGKLLASLLRQLASNLPFLPACLKEVYNFHRSKQTKPLPEDILQLLKIVSTSFLRTFIIIDALDECGVFNGCRSRLLSAISSLEMHNANILVTSRPIPEIVEHFSGKPNLQIHARDEDVRSFLDGEMFRLPSFVASNSKLQDAIKSEIVKSVDGMFLLAQLHLDLLVGERSEKAIRLALENLPTGSEAYEKAYGDAMRRIEGLIEKEKILAKEVLSWITCAKKALTITELEHALAVEIGKDEIDEANMPHIEYMVSLCAGLVTVDKNSRIIRLVHYTTQRYFEQTSSIWFPHAHSYIAEICTSYLSLRAFASGNCSTWTQLKERRSLYPLYEYAAFNWGCHVRCAARCSPSVIQFLQMPAHIEASRQAFCLNYAFEHPWVCLRDIREYRSTVTGLHLAAEFGVEEACVILCKTTPINVQDTWLRTPLSYAAQNGHDAIVELLLANGADIEMSDDKSRNPLLFAALENHLSVIRTLINHNAIVTATDQYGDTPLKWTMIHNNESAAMLLLEKNTGADTLHHSHPGIFHWAAKLGFVSILQLLHKNGMDVNAVKDHGSQPSALLQAAAKGHEAAVKFLLEAGANAHLADTAGDTPLSSAARGGYVDVVRLLLNSGADPNARIEQARTPLVLAVLKENYTMVKLLVENNADVNLQDGQGWTPLIAAVLRGNLEIAKLLIQHGASCIREDILGRTPLVSASMKGHESLVDLLLAYGSDVNSEDRVGRTPLVSAALGGHQAVAQVLLDTFVDVNAKDRTGRTPLISAALKGHFAMIKLLLENGADADGTDDLGCTALSYVASRGQKEEVALLLQYKASANSKDLKGRTPLWRAAEKEYEGVVELLLGHGAEVNIEDNNGDTPLSMAVRGGHVTIVRLFLVHAQGSVATNIEHARSLLLWAVKNSHDTVVSRLIMDGLDVNFVDTEHGRSPLDWAVGNGNIMVVKLLLAANARLDLADGSGQTPLHRAAEKGYDAVFELLLLENAEADAADYHGQTPLLRAAGSGHVSIVLQLLAKSAVFEIPDQYGQTALFHAAKNGHEIIVKTLLDRGAIIDAADRIHKRTPLSIAALNGHEAVVDLLLEYGAEADCKDHLNRTPLMLAALNGHENVVKMMLSFRVSIESRDVYGRTPLYWAVYSGNVTTAAALLQNLANSNSKDNNGRSALTLAIERDQEAVVKLLLDHGAFVDSAGGDGQTPLSVAAELGRVGAVKLLLESGAYVDSIDVEYGRSPLWRASERGHTEVVKLLLAHDADVDLADNDGRKPVFRAAANNHKEVVDLLGGGS
ncbi:hypothetical protein N7539_005578 [Penicillium diatomitis]|uniref:Nucleoside phosphorylase domain-containing protein n=1 Tax=Penicillium diatomitis TaxID=2819901 RepID=A0A9W9X8F5_9EURO|nr:uncharacterized protein N7539_005578 [Penicillium diatomitis]KAJ5485590.1 hypothetical protein N7539_005578 [Penicillium diatomitis]